MLSLAGRLQQILSRRKASPYTRRSTMKRRAHTLASATIVVSLCVISIAAPAGATLLGYVHAGAGIAVVDTEAGRTRKVVPFNRPDGPHGAFALPGPPLAVRDRMVFPYSVTINDGNARGSMSSAESRTSFLLTLDPDSNTAADVPVPREVPGEASFQTATFGQAVSPKGDAVYLTGTANPGGASPSPAILRYDPVSGAAHLIESAALCDARAEGSCSPASCPCGGLIDFLPSPDGATVYVLRDPVPEPFIQHVALVTIDAMSGAITATIDLGDVALGIGRASGRFVSLIDGRLLVAAHVEPLEIGRTRVLAVDVGSGQITQSVVVPVDLATVTAGPGAERLYGAAGSGLTVVDGRSLEPLYTIPLPEAPSSLPGVSPDGSRVALTAIAGSRSSPEFHLETVDVLQRRVVSDVILPFADLGFSGDAPVLLDGCADAGDCFCAVDDDCTLFPCTRAACGGSEGCTYADQVCFRAITCQLPLPTFGFPGACSHFRVRLARLERRAEDALRAGSELAPSTPRRNWTSAVVQAEKAMKRVLSAERGEVVSKPRCVADYELGSHIHFLAHLRRLQKHPGTCPLTGG